MDFFIVTEPAWIEQLPADVKGRLGRPAAAIVSTDLTWITYAPTSHTLSTPSHTLTPTQATPNIHTGTHTVSQRTASPSASLPSHAAALAHTAETLTGRCGRMEPVADS